MPKISAKAARIKSLDHKTFGAICVIKYAGNDAHNNSTWFCQCRCGSAPFIARGSNLTSGNTRSCGCQSGRRDPEPKRGDRLGVTDRLRDEVKLHIQRYHADWNPIGSRVYEFGFAVAWGEAIPIAVDYPYLCIECKCREKRTSSVDVLTARMLALLTACGITPAKPERMTTLEWMREQGILSQRMLRTDKDSVVDLYEAFRRTGKIDIPSR